MPLIKTPHLKMHYKEAGSGKVALVFLHGNFGSWRWWRPVLDRLPSGYCAYAPDLRGCGGSDRPRNGHNIQQLAADLYDFAEVLELSAYHLVAHSLGGAVALQFALDHPERVQSLFLVSSAPAEGMPHLLRTNHNSSWLLRLFSPERKFSFFTLDTAYRMLRTLTANRPMLRRALVGMTPTLARDDDFEELVDDAVRMSPDAAVGYLRSVETWNVQEELGKLRVPVLILWGDQDTLIERDALERTAGDLHQGELVVWPDVGHAPQLEQPERFVGLLREFVDKNTVFTTLGICRFLSRFWSRKIHGQPLGTCKLGIR